MKRKRFVFRDQNDIYSCVAAAKKRKLLRASQDKKEHEANIDAWNAEHKVGSGEPIRLGTSDHAGKNGWWSSEWRSNRRSDARTLWEVRLF